MLIIHCCIYFPNRSHRHRISGELDTHHSDINNSHFLSPRNWTMWLIKRLRHIRHSQAQATDLQMGYGFHLNHSLEKLNREPSGQSSMIHFGDEQLLHLRIKETPRRSSRGRLCVLTHRALSSIRPRYRKLRN